MILMVGAVALSKTRESSRIDENNFPELSAEIGREDQEPGLGI
jgi:hypothetical protein